MRNTFFAASVFFLVCRALGHEGHILHVPAALMRMANPVAKTPDQLKAGEILYGKYCASCHGTNGRADTPAARNLKVHPADLTNFQIRALHDGEIYWVATHGIRHAMPALPRQVAGLDPWRITLWVRELRIRQEAIISAQAGDYDWRLPPGFPYPNVPKDNPMTEPKVELGRRLFYDRRLSENQTQS